MSDSNTQPDDEENVLIAGGAAQRECTACEKRGSLRWLTHAHECEEDPAATAMEDDEDDSRLEWMPSYSGLVFRAWGSGPRTDAWISSADPETIVK